MDLISPSDFLAWARKQDIVPWKSDSTALVYSQNEIHCRFWRVPARVQIPYFISHLLNGLDAWSDCYLWPRDGWWPQIPDDDHIKDKVELCVLAGAGIAANSHGAIRYSAKEVDKLITAVFAKLSFGWCVSDDLYIIPDHARQFMEASHHDVVHVDVRDAERMQQFIQHMDLGEFPLPTKVPDATFKKPHWMK